MMRFHFDAAAAYADADAADALMPRERVAAARVQLSARCFLMRAVRVD